MASLYTHPPKSPDGRLITLLSLLLCVVSHQATGANTAYALYYDTRSNSSMAASTYYGLIPGYNATVWFRPDPPEYRLMAHFPIGPVDIVTDSRYFDMLNRIPEAIIGNKMRKSRADVCNILLTNFGVVSSDVIWVNTTWIKTTPKIRNTYNPPLDFIREITNTNAVTMDKTSRFYYSLECALLIKYWNPAPNFVVYDDYKLVANGLNVYLLKADFNLNKDFRAINASGIVLPRDFCGYLCKKAPAINTINEDIDQYPQKLGEQKSTIGECFWNPAQIWDCNGESYGYLPTLAYLSTTGAVSQAPLSAFFTQFDIRYKGVTYTFSDLHQAEVSMARLVDTEGLVSGLYNLELKMTNILTKLVGTGLREGVVKIIQEEMDVGVLSDWKPSPAMGRMVYLGVVGFSLTLIIVILVIVFGLCRQDDPAVSPKVREEMGNINM